MRCPPPSGAAPGVELSSYGQAHTATIANEKWHEASTSSWYESCGQYQVEKGILFAAVAW